MSRVIKFRGWNYGGMVQIKTITFDDYKEPLMQYTGLIDKNGVEIFEGDIVTWREWHEEVDAGETHTREVAWITEGAWSPFWDFGAENDIEVIGNIYENKDLLK